jgi:hypothetical protein
MNSEYILPMFNTPTNRPTTVLTPPPIIKNTHYKHIFDDNNPDLELGNAKKKLNFNLDFNLDLRCKSKC